MSIISFITSHQAYFEDFITRCTYHSNAIEGSTLSYAGTYALIFNDKSFKVNATSREIYDAINHKYALVFMLDYIEQNKVLTEHFIKTIAIQINKNTNEIDGYRKNQVHIIGAEHMPPPPYQIQEQMYYFIDNYNHTLFSNIYEKLAITHIQFERIHPFSDGNGRTGRLLLIFELLVNNLPPIVIPKDKRLDYFDYLAKQDVVGLAQFFETLHQFEIERIEKFK